MKLICDPKSLLYLFGMELDYSDALVRPRWPGLFGLACFMWHLHMADM